MSIPLELMPEEVQKARTGETAAENVFDITPEPEPTGPKVITLDDIKSSPYLQQNGIMPGDKMDNGQIIRVYSEPEDVRPQGRTLTAQDIANSLYLQENNIKPGDVVNEDGEIVRTGIDSAAKQFMYGFDELGNDVTNLGNWLDQYIPMGELNFTDGYVSAEDRWGEEYLNAPPSQRREMQARARERALLEEYGSEFVFNEQGGAAQAVGNVAKALTTPTTLIPVGQSVRGATAAGGAIGFGYSATEQLTQTGQIDPLKALPETALGAGGAGTLTLLGRGVSKGIDKLAKTASDKLVSRVQANVLQKQADGVDANQALEEVLTELDVSRPEFARAIDLSGRKVKLAATQSRAQNELDAMLATDSAVSRLILPSVDKYLGAISTRIKNKSEPIFGAVRKFEFKTHKRTRDALTRIKPFNDGMRKLPASVKEPLSLALNNGNFNAARGLLRNNAPDLVEEFDSNVVPLIRELGSELEKSGYKNIDLGIDYFPRVVTDLVKFRTSLGVEQRGVIDNAVIKYAQSKGIKTSQMKNSEVYQKLNPDELDMVIDRVIKRKPVTLADGNMLAPRKIPKLTQDQLKYYAKPEDALQMYIRRSIHDLEKRNLFKKNVKTHADGTVNNDETIQSYLAQEVRNGNLKAEDQSELIELLNSRFVGGEQSLGSMASLLRNTGYASTIANPLTALVQLADLAQAGTFLGFRNTVGALFGKKNMRQIDIGIDAATSEMLDPRSTSRILNTLFKASGFQALDQLAKETTINAALRKYANRLSSTNSKVRAKAEAEFAKKYKNVYGDEFDSLVEDLRNGVKSENVKLLAFHELSDFQPISLSEMPQGYLDAKNGRLLYMLKSFTLKQWDIVRRNIYQEAKDGNIAGASRKLAVLAGYLMATNLGVQTTRDFLLGREIRPEDIPSKAMWGLAGVYGINQYVTERYFRSGQYTEGVANYLMPATPVIDDLFKVASDVYEGEDLEPFEYVRSVPVVGPLLYSWFGGGAERYNERLD